jgi:hypothetical protein
MKTRKMVYLGDGGIEGTALSVVIGAIGGR